MTFKVIIELDLGCAKTLESYLKDHEHDIAMGINDFKDLEGLFIAIYEEKPRSIYCDSNASTGKD